VDSALQLY